MSDVLQKVQCTRQDVADAVTNNDKQRFTINRIDGKEYIRANQGHSIPVPDLELKAISSAADIPKSETSLEGVVVHGTYSAPWKAIRKEGLNRMNRNHIHFAVGTPGESHVISGMRSTCQVLIYVDVEKALSDGIPFFLSDNNVVLSPGNAEGVLPTKYFKAVVDASSGTPFDEQFPFPILM